MLPRLPLLEAHQRALADCRRCPRVVPPVVMGAPVASPIYLLGQAPGVREGARGRPFAHTAGTTLFKWFASLGVDEAAFRQRVYMAAVLRCFPGKAPRGGDRVPAREEIQRCQSWIASEVSLLSPQLVIAVGKLAIAQVLGRAPRRLDEVVGTVRQAEFHGRQLDWLALPHPSGLSSWHKTSPGKERLAQALQQLGRHPVWQQTFVDAGQGKRPGL